MNLSMFRPLLESEIEDWKLAARNKYVPGNTIDIECWHPIYCAECCLMNFEVTQTGALNHRD